MTAYTVDASTVLAFLLPEAHSAAAGRFFASLSPEDDLIEPALMLVECTSNLRRKVYEGTLPAVVADEKLRQALRITMTQVTSVSQHPTALEFADRRRSRRAYDEHYLAVAFSEGTELVTIDGGMYQGAVELQINARLLR